MKERREKRAVDESVFPLLDSDRFLIHTGFSFLHRGGEKSDKGYRQTWERNIH